MKPVFFPSPAAFRKWLEKNHSKKSELYVGFYKVSTGRPTMTWSESVDQALCFGWIDGVRRSVDEESYCIRFTPRKPTSIWSAINIKKVEDLTKSGLMHASGLEAFSRRKAEKSAVYSFERAAAQLSPEYERRFRANSKAWTYFQSLAPSYRKTSVYWVMSAKQESTRKTRLASLITASARGINPWKDNKYSKKNKKK